VCVNTAIVAQIDTIVAVHAKHGAIAIPAVNAATDAQIYTCGGKYLTLTLTRNTNPNPNPRFLYRRNSVNLTISGAILANTAIIHLF